MREMDNSTDALFPAASPAPLVDLVLDWLARGIRLSSSGLRNLQDREHGPAIIDEYKTNSSGMKIVDHDIEIPIEVPVLRDEPIKPIMKHIRRVVFEQFFVIDAGFGDVGERAAIFTSLQQLKEHSVVKASPGWRTDTVQQYVVDAVAVEVGDIDIYDDFKVGYIR